MSSAPFDRHLSRRALLGTASAFAAAALAAPAFAQAVSTTTDPNSASSTEMEADISNNIRHNISSFRALAWQDYFENTDKGAILVDLTSRALHYWNADQTIYKLYPCSVAATDDLTRRGRTEVVDKVVNPPWRPTPAMRIRFPDWPEFMPGGDPKNPLGSRALYLGWQYFRIHGTQDTRKIGRRSSNGCVGLYNEHILELFDLAQVGTQVLMI